MAGQLERLAKAKEIISGKKEKPVQSPDQLWDILTDIAWNVAPSDAPPPHILHIGQVRHLVNVMYPGDDDAETFAITHDYGRGAGEQDDGHTELGAMILEYLGCTPQAVRFAREHHKFGLQSREEAARQLGAVALAKQIIENEGISWAITLIADVSKQVKPGTDHNTEIVPFTRELGMQLIGSHPSDLSVLGVEFILALIPLVEESLGISYSECIKRASASWPTKEKELIASWKKIAYDDPNDH